MDKSRFERTKMTLNLSKTIESTLRNFCDIKKIFFFLLFFIIAFPKIPIIPTGFVTSVRLEDIIIAYLWIWILVYISREKVKIYKNEIFFWVGAYLLWQIFSTALGAFQGYVTTPLFLLRQVEYISLFFFAYVIIDKNDLPKFYKLVFVSFGIVALVGLIQYSRILELSGIAQKLIPYTQPGNARFWGSKASLVSSTFDGNYDLGGYLILLVPFFLLLLLSRYTGKKILLATAFLASLVLVLVSGARTPAVIIAGIVFAIFLMKMLFGLKKQRLRLLIILISLISAVVIGQKIFLSNLLGRMQNLNLFNYESIISFLQSDQSMSLRLERWSFVWDSFLRHPLAGVGVGGFSKYFFGVDGQHVQTLGEVGMVGLAIFFVLFISVIKMNFITLNCLKKLLPSKELEINKAFLAALSIGILGLMLDGVTIDIFNSSKVAMCLWVFIGVAAKLNIIYKYQND